MKRQISNPYKLNWKMYSLIGGISAIIMVVAVVWNVNAKDVVSDIIKNLAFGCVASTLVALLIEIGNTKEKNEKANSIYDSVYSDLKFQIMHYIELWSCLCSVSFKDEEYHLQKYTWTEWYEITKRKFEECDDNRQAELIVFFNDQLTDCINGIEKALIQIESQQYILNINNVYDNELRKILENYRFEFYAAKLTLGRKYNKHDFWGSFDAIEKDLANYINNWVDIKFYNYCKFAPYSSLFDDEDEVRQAILKSE